MAPNRQLRVNNDPKCYLKGIRKEMKAWHGDHDLKGTCKSKTLKKGKSCTCIYDDVAYLMIYVWCLMMLAYMHIYLYDNILSDC